MGGGNSYLYGDKTEGRVRATRVFAIHGDIILCSSYVDRLGEPTILLR
jgi:hypothetical protein